jgi:glucokinase
LLLTLGTGIGSDVVHDGELLGIAAAAGHMSINLSGEKCPCGNYGCLEQFAGGVRWQTQP